ncbi:MAG: hypothetical protein KAI47_00830, partial [Deltaproteobacteria bacterium]|nr:hypothetical protein [Deltaproteobacteria bacterium]
PSDVARDNGRRDTSNAGERRDVGDGDGRAGEGDLSGIADLPADMGHDTTGPCVQTLIPAPCQAGYDAPLEALATNYERGFHTINATATGLWNDVQVSNAAHRAAIETFLKPGGGWDIKGATGQDVTTLVTAWRPTAGLYSGVGLAADAFRYGTLRDEGYPKAEVDRARTHLLAALEGLHVAKTITGRPESIARGTLRTDMPASVPATIPLVDGQGQPLPVEKNNGTWRADNSVGHVYANYVWEDSCSRDQLVGWVAGYGAAWEVIAADSSIPQKFKDRLRVEARDLGRGLAKVQASGYDLELVDADGRTTYHGYLHESAFDRLYIPNPFIKNGINAIMALGIVATLAYVAGDPGLDDYLAKELIARRKLHDVAQHQMVVDAGPKTNYSGYNMAFMGAWLVSRYLADPQARAAVRKGIDLRLYHNQLSLGPPAMWKDSLFDLIYVTSAIDASVHSKTTLPVDPKVIGYAIETLHAFPQPPFWDVAVINCDAKEIAVKTCTAIDGKTTFALNSEKDRSGDPQSLTPVPFSLRPPSNYDWRSNPYRVNGGGTGTSLFGAADFRFAYWLGRWVKR